jgi:predicted dehydrogenase
MEEVAAFVESVRTRTMPRVTAADGLRVMELSERILAAIEKETVASRS